MSNTPPPFKNKKSFWGKPEAVAIIVAAVIGTIGVIVGALVGNDVINVTVPGSSTASPAPMAPTTSPAITPAPPMPTPTASAPVEAATQAATQAATYVDDYAQECRAATLTAGAASINGTDYAHTILQWPGDSEPVTIKRKAHQFEATIGVRDDASDQVRVQFELLGDNGKQLFKSRVLSYGESQKVDVSVEGVLRITLRARAVSSKYGYAGWGDARLTAPTKPEC